MSEPVPVEPTGHPEVDAALARLEELAGVETGARVAVYEDVHQRLAGTLSALDEQQQ
ncbi:hypothetical protein [Saccharothrix sp. ST-888]|uniref:hypothetical protein n=1 Tax=Saccharothrix sp. ST-888 TaxID=1427391 RepID=UPI0012E0902F|nr:hypothetical protein [Saccharothrix sp. ST-888]